MKGFPCGAPCHFHLCRLRAFLSIVEGFLRIYTQVHWSDFGPYNRVVMRSCNCAIIRSVALYGIAVTHSDGAHLAEPACRTANTLTLLFTGLTYVMALFHCRSCRRWRCRIRAPESLPEVRHQYICIHVDQGYTVFWTIDKRITPCRSAPVWWLLLYIVPECMQVIVMSVELPQADQALVGDRARDRLR